MKFSPNISIVKRAFTLLELLVVISIIAVLAGILLPVSGAVMENARKVQAKSTEMQIITAVKSFQTDYGLYPVMPSDSANGTQDVTYGEGTLASKLMDLLRADGQGYDVAGTTINTRRIVYIEMPVVKNFAKPVNGIGQDGMPYDPWGRTYFIKIDSNYDNAVSNPYQKNAGFDPIGTGVVVYSFGKDKDSDPSDKNAAKSKDDVISWQ